MNRKLTGLITAIITPFKQGKVDYESLGRLVKWQIDQGIDGFVVHGTTGESPTVQAEERKAIFDYIKSKVPTGFPLIVGTGSNSTAQTVQLSKEAEAWGAEAVLVVVPYYNKPPQRGLEAHFTAVADAIGIPLILYNVPSRTVTTLEVATIHKLSQHPRIVGIKEATGNLKFAEEIQRACGTEFILLSGDDGTADQFQKQGGHGVISVTSHVFPKAMKQLKTGDYQSVIDAMFAEANPIGVKMALKQMGVIDSAELRLPLVEMAPDLAAKLKSAMLATGCLK